MNLSKDNAQGNSAERQQQNNGYGQPQQNGYGQPQQNGYGQPQQNNGYGQPQNNGYGQPQQNNGYGQPQNNGYGQPQQNNGYGQTQNNGYGQPQQNNGYGQPQQNNGYGQPQQNNGYGQKISDQLNNCQDSINKHQDNISDSLNKFVGDANSKVNDGIKFVSNKVNELTGDDKMTTKKKAIVGLISVALLLLVVFIGSSVIKLIFTKRFSDKSIDKAVEKLYDDDLTDSSWMKESFEKDGYEVDNFFYSDCEDGDIDISIYMIEFDKSLYAKELFNDTCEDNSIKYKRFKRKKKRVDDLEVTYKYKESASKTELTEINEGEDYESASIEAVYRDDNKILMVTFEGKDIEDVKKAYKEFIKKI